MPNRIPPNFSAENVTESIASTQMRSLPIMGLKAQRLQSQPLHYQLHLSYLRGPPLYARGRE